MKTLGGCVDENNASAFQTRSRWPWYPVKRVARFTYGDALLDANETGDIPVFGSNGAFGRHSEPNTGSPVVFIGRKGSCGALNWSDVPAFAIDTVFFVDNHSCSANLRWFYWALHAAHLDSFSQDTGVPGLSRALAHATRLPVPPPEDQIAIASFLDREAGKIDRLISEQERLVSLLGEKREAVISHAVTKGLNPDVPMKSCGVEWLSEVPGHWRVTRLKYSTDLIVDCPHETPTYDADGEYLVVRTADVEDGVLDPGDMYRLSQEQYQTRTRRQTLIAADIVYSREGERWGHAARVPESDRYCLGQRMMQFRAASDVDPEFLMWQLNSDGVRQQGEVDTVGATSPHVNVGTIRNFRFAQPELDEQREVAEFLRRQTKAIDELVAETRRAISLLNERRAALISEAVTGGIDVRERARAEIA